MSDKGLAKSSIIIIVVLLIAVIGVVFFVLTNKEERVEYFQLKGYKKCDGVLIEDYKTFSKLAKEANLDTEMTSSVTYNRHVVLDYFNESYFNSKKLAAIATYEDTSKNYIYSIDEVIYNEERTSVTIKYTDKTDGYSGTLGSTWQNYMFVELEPTVTSVNFVKENKVVEE